MCTAWLFSPGSTCLQSNFTWTWSSLSTILGIRRLETLGCLSMCRRFDTILECDGQTDGFVVAYTALAKLAVWCAVKTVNSVYSVEEEAYLIFCHILLQNLLQHLPKVKHLVYFESRKRPVVDAFPPSVSVHSLSHLEALGAKPESRQGCC